MAVRSHTPKATEVPQTLSCPKAKDMLSTAPKLPRHIFSRAKSARQPPQSACPEASPTGSGYSTLLEPASTTFPLSLLTPCSTQGNGHASLNTPTPDLVTPSSKTLSPPPGPCRQKMLITNARSRLLHLGVFIHPDAEVFLDERGGGGEQRGSGCVGLVVPFWLEVVVDFYGELW